MKHESILSIRCARYYAHCKHTLPFKKLLKTILASSKTINPEGWSVSIGRPCQSSLSVTNPYTAVHCILPTVCHNSKYNYFSHTPCNTPFKGTGKPIHSSAPLHGNDLRHGRIIRQSAKHLLPIPLNVNVGKGVGVLFGQISADRLAHDRFHTV